MKCVAGLNRFLKIMVETKERKNVFIKRKVKVNKLKFCVKNEKRYRNK